MTPSQPNPTPPVKDRDQDPDLNQSTARAKSAHPFARVNCLHWLIGVAMVALSGLVWNARGTLSAGIGVLIASANFHFVSRSAARALSDVAGQPSADVARAAAVGLITRLVAKMFLSMAVIWAVLSFFDLLLAPFALGLSVFVISILAVGLTVAAAEAKPPQAKTPQAEESQ